MRRVNQKSKGLLTWQNDYRHYDYTRTNNTRPQHDCFESLGNFLLRADNFRRLACIEET